MGQDVPKGVVLLADVIPSFLTKLAAPYFIHTIPYPMRILAFVTLSATGMLLIALTPGNTDARNISIKMAGVVLASLSSGGGELTFVGLVHYYGPFSLAAWGSGTGGAGLIGAGAYALARITLGLSVRTTLLTSACLPAVMLASFYLVLPLGPLKNHSRESHAGRAHLSEAGEEQTHRRDGEEAGVHESNDEEEHDDVEHSQRAGLLSNPRLTHTSRKPTFASRSPTDGAPTAWLQFQHNLHRARGLFFPFMLPLLLVYIAEYTINQGVAPTLLFPLTESPFSKYRSFYPAYGAIYQAGVFVSRSSTPFFRVHNLYFPSLLQVLNLIILTIHALFDLIPSVYIVFIIIFWEGLLGGLVYVNTFAEISDTVDKRDREFSLSATTVSDSGGICIAGFLSMVVEVWLCNWQVQHGREFCRLVEV